MQVIFFSFLNCVILWHSIVYSLLLWSRWNRSKFLLVCHGKRTEWSRIRSVILRVITTSICLLRVGLQTELDDAKSHYQLFIKITISDKRRIAKLLKKGKICFKRKIKEASIVRCRSENDSVQWNVQGKISPFWKEPQFRILCTVSVVIETKVVIGWFKVQLWVWLAYWTIRKQTVR